MEIVFLPPAKGELSEAVSYYNAQSEGLGFEFAAEVKKRAGNMEVAAQERVMNHGITRGSGT